MSVRIYSSPGNSIFPRPTVLRQYVPGRVSRQVRYTRSLSSPLGPDKEFSYAPWETSSRDFINSLLDSKRRDLTRPMLDSKRRDLIKSPLETKQELTFPSSESKRRDLIGNLWEPKTISLPESKRRHLYNNPLEIKQRELTIPFSESKRRDFTSNLLESSRRNLTDRCSENKGINLTNNHSDNNRRDLPKSYLDDKGKDSSNNHLETKSKTLIETPRAIRWWKKEQNLCTPDDLLGIILEPTGHYELPTDPCNEVYPGVLLSDGPTALCTSMLKRMGVSHVLNAAQGKERPGQVNTSPSFYNHSRIRFLGVEAFDHIAFRLYPYFDEASDFIEEALDSGGKVLVHCRAGISRSATLVCAFLMLKRRLSAQEAIRAVRKNRPIIPNDGFLQQLCDLNERLHKTRGP